MVRLQFALLLLGVSLISGIAAEPSDEKEWWQTAVLYQIYPRSFKDSDGDGIGDLQGVISGLDHLKDAGVTAAWLSPICKSPQVDTGYDISDYKAIHYEYGTMEDFEELIQKANELGIKIIMDMVPNHSSDQHEWFVLSENRTAGYEDYYVWRDGPNGDDITPPNNWRSVFRFSAWTYSDIRGQWYLHQFLPQQPDLNFENPKVLQEMLDVMQFWLEKGVYGFRVDAVPFIAESQTFADEPLSGLPGVGPDDYDYTLHYNTHSLPKSYEVIYSFREFLDEYNNAQPEEETRIMMTEAYANLTATMKWYGDGMREGAHFTFNFLFIPFNNETTAEDIINKVDDWMAYMPSGKTANWVLGNHDNHRLASRVKPEDVNGYTMLVHVLPGVAVTYQREEIAMADGEVTWEQCRDPSACNGKPEDFERLSRDFERTPFHWDDTKNAGFSTADETWLPVSEKYHENNLAQQETDPNSHFALYKNLTALRKASKALRGDSMAIATEGDVILVKRTETPETIVYINNLGDKKAHVDVTNIFPDIVDDIIVLINGTPVSSSKNIQFTKQVKNGKQHIIAHVNPHTAIIGKVNSFIHASIFIDVMAP